MKPVLLTRVDSEDHGGKSVHIYAYRGQTWAFVAHSDPGYDYLIRPNGETRETYTPWGDAPEGVDQALWEQFIEDCSEMRYGKADR